MSQGSCDPSRHLAEPHLQGWGGLCPPGHSWDLLCSSSLPPWVHSCRKGEATAAQQGTKQDWSIKFLLLLGENRVCLVSACTGNDRQSFPGKGLHPPHWEHFLVGSSSKQAHSTGLCQWKRQKESSVFSAQGEISTRACFFLHWSCYPHNIETLCTRDSPSHPQVHWPQGTAFISLKSPYLGSSVPFSCARRTSIFSCMIHEI